MNIKQIRLIKCINCRQNYKEKIMINIKLKLFLISITNTKHKEKMKNSYRDSYNNSSIWLMEPEMLISVNSKVNKISNTRDKNHLLKTTNLQLL